MEILPMETAVPGQPKRVARAAHNAFVLLAKTDARYIDAYDLMSTRQDARREERRAAARIWRELAVYATEAARIAEQAGRDEAQRGAA